MMEKDKDSIQVMVRVRPLNERERNEGAKSCINFNEEIPNSLILDSRPEPKNFYFDFVGGEKTTQEDIFRIVGKTLTTACLEGAKKILVSTLNILFRSPYIYYIKTNKI
jgi:kinesin family member 15